MTGTRTSASWRQKLNPQALGIYVAAVVIFIVFGLLNHTFFGIGNLRDIAISASINAIIGLGLTFVIITGGIDLSVGSTASLVGIVSANLMVSGETSPVVAIVVGIVLGIACGVVNGVLITAFRLPPFIATLGTMSVYQGLAYLVTNGLAVYGIPQPFIVMINGYVGYIPIMVIIVVVVGILSWLLLRKTVVGENVIATGGSEETAWLSGIRISRVKITVYALAGGLAGLAGLMLVARINAAQNEGGSPYLLTAIAAAVIGGANLMGGEGRIAGTLVGALILGALTNGLVLLNVPSFYEQIVIGLVVIIAVGLGQGTKGWPMFKRGGPPAEKSPAEQPSTADEPQAATNE
ncbi:ABC transporter permease [Arthrobacter dokdonensis]|uniref:ABC transporter permease n=1 Tax=Arthrobacter dokdonellae TaxID=2211210 RepID=UPI00149414F4|nr:ABC transporter permease [Arthrobacter dokdonellae]